MCKHVTIKTGNYGTKYAIIEGDGYPREVSLDSVIHAGRCPVCGLDLTEHPHSEAQCAEWFAEDYRDADETRADLWQF